MIVGQTMWTQSTSVTDRQTDRRTDRITITKTVQRRASHGNEDTVTRLSWWSAKCNEVFVLYWALQCVAGDCMQNTSVCVHCTDATEFSCAPFACVNVNMQHAWHLISYSSRVKTSGMLHLGLYSLVVGLTCPAGKITGRDGVAFLYLLSLNNLAC